MSDKSWEPEHSLTLTPSHYHSFTLLFTHSPHAEQLLFSCLCWKGTFSHSHTLSFTLSRHAEQLLFSCLRSKETVYSRKLQCFFWTSSAAASPYPVSLEFIELVPSKKLKMYFYSLHYLIAALKSKLGMNLFQSHWLGCWGTTPITSVVVESVPENSFLSKTSNC